MDKKDNFFRKLDGRADLARAVGASKMTGGGEGEPVLAQGKVDGVHVVQRPDDSQGILRISVGGGTPHDIDYCIFRGNREACLALLKRVTSALEKLESEKENVG